MTPEPRARSLLIKPASGDCNLHCAYCFYHERPTDPYRQAHGRRMSAAVLDALIRQGMALDRRQATFGWQGGEPTLAGLDFFRQAVVAQQRHGAAGQAVSNGIQTNGLLLTPAWAQFLARYNFLVGVSLDGAAAYHDRYRTTAGGEGTHARVLGALRMLQHYGVEYNILAVVNRVTADHGPEIYDDLLSQGHQYLQFIPCVEVDPATGRPTDFSVGPEQFGDFLCALFDRWYNGGQPEASVRDFDALLAGYLGEEPPLCPYQAECGGYLVVEYNGDVYPCDFFVQEPLRLGNIMDAPPADAPASATMLETLFGGEGLRRFAQAKAVPRPECAACPWQWLCRQGCPRFVGVAGGAGHYLCRAYQRFFAHSESGFLALRDAIRAEQAAERGVQAAASRHALEARGAVAGDAGRAVGRNDPCPCGSGKKFKHCCGRVRSGQGEAGR